jgi:hypothetical protein
MSMWLGGSKAALLGKLLYPTLGWVVVRRPCLENYCIAHLAGWW